MIKAYIASRLSRKDEMQEIADRLRIVDIENISSWVTGAHDYVGVPDDRIPVADQANFAQEDLREIRQADMFLVFTDKPGRGGSRGGKHVEMGFALAIGKPIVIIGPLENIFYSWASVQKDSRHYEDLDAFIDDWVTYASYRRSHWAEFVRLLPWR